jgi:hypothetical protein
MLPLCVNLVGFEELKEGFSTTGPVKRGLFSDRKKGLGISRYITGESTIKISCCSPMGISPSANNLL